MAPKSVPDPPQGGQSAVWVRWWLVWISMGLFTHYRPHRQDTVKTAYARHVCLNYRQAMTGQLLSSTIRHERESLRFCYRNSNIFLTFPYWCSQCSLLSSCPTTKTCNWDHLSAEGSSLAEVTEQSYRCWKCLRCRMIVGCVCLLVPSCSAFIGTLLQEKTKSKADQSVLIATVASMRAVYD